MISCFYLQCKHLGKSNLIRKMKKSLLCSVIFTLCDMICTKKEHILCVKAFIQLFVIVCKPLAVTLVCRPQVACGLNHTLVVSTDGMMVWAFGDGDYGKLGLGNSTAKSSPQVGAMGPLTVNMRPQHHCVPITRRNQWELLSGLNWITVVTS